MLLSKESLLLRKFEFEYETEDEDAPQWDWNKLGSYLVPLYAIGRTTSLLGFPIQRPNQNEDSQTSNPFFPALTKSSPAAWSTPDGRSPPIRSRPGCEVTAGSQTWPNHSSHPKIPPISVSASLSLDYFRFFFLSAPVASKQDDGRWLRFKVVSCQRDYHRIVESILFLNRSCSGTESRGSEQAWREPCGDAAPRGVEQGCSPVPWLCGLQGTWIMSCSEEAFPCSLKDMIG